MPADFYIATGSIIVAFLLYTWLMIVNYRDLIATKQERLAARRLERSRRKAKYVFPR